MIFKLDKKYNIMKICFFSVLYVILTQNILFNLHEIIIFFWEFICNQTLFKRFPLLHENCMMGPFCSF